MQRFPLRYLDYVALQALYKAKHVTTLWVTHRRMIEGVGNVGGEDRPITLADASNMVAKSCTAGSTFFLTTKRGGSSHDHRTAEPHHWAH